VRASSYGHSLCRSADGGRSSPSFTIQDLDLIPISITEERSSYRFRQRADFMYARAS
jgi:hypothetical protein